MPSETSSTKLRRTAWLAAAVSALLLELPFPLAGPMPPWRSIFAWFALAPLLWAVLANEHGRNKKLSRAFLLGYLTGFLWYLGNCYWVRDTMAKYGGLPSLVPVLLLVGFSLVLGLYFGLFALCLSWIRRGSGDTRIALAAAPFLWTALELAASRITSVPWDQLGYSQVDNGIVNQLAPWTGVYGISFLLVAVNAFIAGAFLVNRCPQRSFWKGPKPWGIAGVVLMAGCVLSVTVKPPSPPATAVAALIQPNLDVGDDTRWDAPGEWDRHIAEFQKLAASSCGPYITGIPQTDAPTLMPKCVSPAAPPDLVVWPESPAPFDESDVRFQQALKTIATSVHAPIVTGGIGWSYQEQAREWEYFNSALVIGADGARVGRYDKIHLVPFGEYVPFADLLTFARKLTGRVSKFTRGTDRKTFRLPTTNDGAHRYGVFICYEAVFADEIRQFARLGAEALVNVSDDGWYGETSAPWQHLNMVRMRAIENRRWILRDTNNGVTAVIDPYGRVRQSIARNQTSVLPVRFAFRDDVTFYTEHGDVFAWLCVFCSVGMIGWAFRSG